MEAKKETRIYTNRVSDSFANTEQDRDEQPAYELAFRRWLVREIASGRLTIRDAVGRFNFDPHKGFDTIKYWCRRYPPPVDLSLPAMTEKEKQKLEALQERVRLLEKQLQDAQMKAIALDTMIDVAEENLKIGIRKKAGTKQ